MAPPNMVLIHCHDLGQYLGCYGSAVDTPRIDDLAADGVRFDRHFVTAPQCSPSRSSLVTGRHPHQNGMLGLAHGDWEIGPDERLLPQFLGEAGYETHRFGLQHVTEYPDRLGYDHEHVEEPLRANTPPSVHETARADEVSERVASMLAAGDHDDPFFASVGFFELHRVESEDGFGFEPERHETPDPEDVEPLPFLPDRPGIRDDIAEVRGMLGALDEGVGTIVDAVDDAGLAEETLIVFTTEHGLAFPRAKGCCFDPGIEAALLLRQPGTLEDGRVVDDLVSNVDVFSTLLEIAGADVPENVAGRSFAPLLGDGAVGAAAGRGGSGGREYEPRERVFAGMTWHDRYNPMRAVRTDRYKYVRNFWHLPEIYLTRDIYESAAGREVREEYYCEQRPYVELYDLESDPDERENLADDSDYEEVRRRLRDDLVEWMLDTDDPLLEGPVRPSDWEEIHPRMDEDLE